MTATDADLVAKSLRRDADAFASLVERHQRLVFGVALARCGDPALAEDLAQEAFVTAWRDLGRLRDADRVGSWVAGIARNLASSATRDAARRAEAVLPEPAPAASPEDQLVDAEDRALLQRTLADVPAPLREALVLYYFEGQSVARIAAALGLREDLVKQRLSRGRRALRDGIADRVESTLTRLRPGPAFGAGVVAAVLALPPAPSAAAATTLGKAGLVMTTTHKLGLAIAAVAVAGGATWIALSGDDAPAEARTAAPATGSAAPTTTGSPGSAAVSAAVPGVRRLAQPGERDALLGRIRTAQRKRAQAAALAPGGGGGGGDTGAPSTSPEPDEVDLDKDYIRGAVRGLVPLLIDCYALGAERDPELNGTVMVQFTIEGEPDVGGIVTTSVIDAAADKTTLRDPQVLECIQETMYALEIDPPRDGGAITVNYPFAFAPAPPPPPEE